MSDYDPFAASYDALASAMTDDIAFYVSLAAEASGPVVELAVGNGRVAVPVALETGRRVVGIDLSPVMLEGARERAREAGVELDLRIGDMRSFDLDEPTDLVICPFRAMLHLSSQDERVEVLRRVRESLVPGGRFAWNVFAFDPEVARGYDGQWRDDGGVRNRADYDYAERRIDLSLASGASVSLWWVDRHEWETAVAASSLEVEALYGWFDRRPFDETSREQVWVTRRP